MSRLVVVWILLAISITAQAQLLSKTSKEQLIEKAKQEFWGNAVLSDGKKVQPASEEERNSLIISEELASYIAEVGAISGAGKWCGLDWQSHYFALTAAARKRGLSEKQVAFVGFLHGVAYGNFSSALMNNAGACDAEQKANIQKLLEKSKAALKEDST